MMVSAIAIVFAVVFFVVGITTVYQGKGEQTVTFAVSILVAFVPEGLPSVVTLLYVVLIGFQRMLTGLQVIDCREAHGGAECPCQGLARC